MEKHDYNNRRIILKAHAPVTRVEQMSYSITSIPIQLKKNTVPSKECMLGSKV